MDDEKALTLIAENLASLDPSERALSIRRAAQVRELALQIAQPEILQRSPEDALEMLQERYQALLGRLTALRSADRFSYEDTLWLRLPLCRALGELCFAKLPDPFRSEVSSEPLPPAVHDRIACLRSGLNDAAYDRFAALLARPTVEYGRNFEAVCEEVYDGGAQYGILPVENTADGRLAGICRLIGRYELKKVMTCTVPAGENSAAVFALLERSLPRLASDDRMPPPLCFRGGDGNLYLSGTLTFAEGGITPDAFLFGARCCGWTLHKMDALPLTYAESGYAYDLIFRSPRAVADPADRFRTFLWFLAMETPQMTLDGLYSHLPPI